jgi:hypothetical protein
LHFTFNVGKYFPFIGQYFGCCKYVVRRGTPGFSYFQLKSDFAYGQVVVGVRPTLPVQDISLLFGINVAGGRL